ncbi:APC family permease [Cyanobium sp. Maggiore-St4-Cus]|uniref:APC family permease n=1 Tax=Cyanobium sp. Maggiore-St4-Cus TaxID=2823717 RepID=UPI0020CCD7CE|nr:APC family permease [Cyanobium sp. Maggiore-St4-Cus]MCP9788831.1 APC family permease [Cyanobium sp. Maggiore-St4-Cus]
MVAASSAKDRLKRRLFGNPLPRDQEEARTVPSFQALPILSSDALSSVAYATDAALGVLILAGSGALSFSLPITITIVALIAIVVFSYRQTITAYPQGGGAYVVGRANLGTLASLVAAASLLIDYVLTAAVSLMAGTQALSSLWPWLLNWQVLIALVLLVLVGWANLRGVREAGRLFALPTYAFVVMVMVLAVAGLQNLIFSHGFSPDPPPLVKAVEPLGLFLILRAFSSGCSAMTGIEAIANGVQLFRSPSAQRARNTLLVMGLLLASMFLAVSGLGFMYGVAPNPDVTVMAQLGMRVFGPNTPLLWVLQITTLLILMLAANTAFADFPRLSALLARDNFLPRQMAWVGDRLVFQNGIKLLLVATAGIILICQGNTTVAVNLYAVGVFLAFTLSQAGMVVHWCRERGVGWLTHALMNGIGSTSTCLVLVVIVISKFAEGAWSVVIAIPLLVLLLARTRMRYRQVYAELDLKPGESSLVQVHQRSEPIGNISIVWIPAWNRPTIDALRYAATVSDRVIGVWVRPEDGDPELIRREWQHSVGDDPNLELQILESPFSSLINPFADFVDAIEERDPAQTLTIVMPMAIPRYRADSLLLNQRAINMRAALDQRQNRVFTMVRYYLPA